MSSRAAGSGLAVSDRLDEAALEAALQALAALGQDHADLAFVFVAGGAFQDTHELLHVIRRVTGARAVLGCSGAGVLTERGEVEGSTAVAVLAIHDVRIVATPFLIEDQGATPAAEVADRVAATIAEGGCLVVLPGLAGLDARALLGGLDEAFGFVPVLGAVAAGGPVFELSNTAAAVGGLAGVAISGPEPVIGVAQGCMPIGEPYVITSASNTIVRSIGGRPPLHVLKDAVASIPGLAERIEHAGVFAGLAIDAAKSPLGQGDFLVRNLIGMDPGSGAIAVAEPVRVGQTFQFQIRDARASREDLQETLGDIRRRLGNGRPAFGCYFNCAGRGRGLFGVPDHDVSLIRETLGDFPLIGFFGNGEFAPVGRRNFFHTYTGALVVFPA